MVGSSIMRSFIKKGYKNIITIERSELDLTDEKNVRDWPLYSLIFSEIDPKKSSKFTNNTKFAEEYIPCRKQYLQS